MKREKYKSNKALALFLCAAVLLFSIGLALARGLGESEPYKTTDLVLTQGDSDYDLTSGISYDTGKYTLAVTDQGGFDINTPGTYVVGYTLTPITGSAVTALPSKPAPVAPDGDQSQEKPPAVNPEETTPAKPDEDSSGTDATVPPTTEPDVTKPDTPKPDTTKPDTTKPDTTKPDTTKPDTTKPDTSKPDTTKPDTTKPDTSKPDTTKPDTSKPDTTKPDTTKPDTTKPDTSKPDTTKPDTSKPDTTKPDTTKPDTTKPDTSKPDTTKPDTSKPDTTKPDTTKPDTSKPDTSKPDTTKPDTTQDAPKSSTAAPDSSASASTKAAAASSLAATTQQGSVSLSQNLLTAASGYGVAAASDPLLIADAAQSDASKQKDGKGDATKTDTSKPDANKSEGSASTGDQSATTEPEKPSTGDQSATTEPEKPSTGDQSTTTEPEKPSTGDQSATTEPEKPSTGDQSATTEPEKPSTGDQSATTEPEKPSTGDQSATTEPEKPSTGDQSATTEPTAPESQSQTGTQGAGGSTTQPEAQPEKLEPITFTRNVVVTPAVEYQDLRLDVSSAKPDTDEINGALLSGMKFDDKKYTVKVTDDGHFFPDRIGEYHVSYELSDAKDGHVISQFQRYVWVTAQGVTFDAPPLTVDASKDYDLLAGIQYNSKKYDLSLVDLNAFDVTKQEPQRVMYRLTPRADSQKKDQGDQANQPDQTENTKATAQAGSENTSPAGVTDQSASNNGQTGQLVAAVFGREVTVDGGHFIHIDAPPLIVTLGAVQTVNLLEGAKATDEKGNPVPLAVVDRSELDKSIKKAEAADPSAAKNPEPTSTAPEPTNTATPPALESSAQVDQPFSPMVMMRSSMPHLGSSAGTNLKTEDDKASSSASDTTNGKTTSSAMDTASGSENETTTSSAVDSQGGTTPSDSGKNPPVIDLSANVTLPANLDPGTYQILMKAVDPKTGISKQFTRKMMLRSAWNYVALLKRVGDGPDSEINQYTSIAAAVQAAGNGQWGTAENPITYTIALTSLNGREGYKFTTGEQKILTNMGNMNQYTTIVFTGKYDGSIAMLNMDSNQLSTLQLPVTSDYNTSSHFVFQDIKIKYSNEFYLVANGHQLTMGTGVNLAPTAGQGFNIVGGGKDSTALPSDIHTNVIINSGQTYNHVCGGNWNEDTKGSTRVEITDQAGGTLINWVYGGSGGDRRNSSGNEMKFNMTGTTDVRIGGGTFINVFGGTQGDMNGSSSVKVTGGTLKDPGPLGGGTLMYAGSANAQVGSSSLTITGGTLTGAVFGGSTNNTGYKDGEACNTTVEVDGSTAYVNSLTAGGPGEQNGNGVLNFENGTVGNLYGGCHDTGSGTETLNINGGTVTGKIEGGSGAKGNAGMYYIINMNSNLSVNRIAYFDELNLKDDVKLSVNDRMVNYDGGVNVYLGRISFGANSVLSLANSNNNVGGDLIPKGQGASLELTRTGDRTKPSLTLNAVAPVSTSADEPLNLKLIGPTADQVNSGDLLIQVQKVPNHANDLLKLLTPTFSRGLFLQVSDQKVHHNIDGDVYYKNLYVGHAVGLQDVSAPGNPLVYYGTVAAAMNDVKTGSDYTLTIRKQNYALTLADGIAIATQGGGAGHITFTGSFVATDLDPLESGDTVGSIVRQPRTVVVGSDPSLQQSGLEPDISFTTNTTVEKLTLEYQIGGGSIYANGHKLLVGDGVQINSDAASFPVLYGGAKDTSVASTDMELHSGSFSGIYGGGKGTNASVTTTNVSVLGGQLYGALYGGGKDGAVTGKATVIISGGDLMAATPTAGENRVIGGGENGDVGSCDITITGGTAHGRTEVAGCYHGNVNGPVSISITKEPKEGDPGTTVPFADVYGGSVQVANTTGEVVGKVTGGVSIHINGGQDYGTISGCGRPTVATSDPSSPDSTVAGNRSITFTSPDKSNVQALNVVNFDQLNLGAENTNSITMTINGALDSNWGLSGNFNRKGNLNFYDGSKLNLKGAVDSPKVQNITVDSGADPSHLHIQKGTAGTNPMYVSGETVRAGTTKLVLGVLDGKGVDIGKNGDRLLVFADSNKISDSDYIGDSQTLQITHSGDTVMYGKPVYPTAKLIQVEPQELELPAQPGTVRKKLIFELSGKDTDGSLGSPINSAYVNTKPTPDDTWANGGPIEDLWPVDQPGILQIDKKLDGSGNWDGTTYIGQVTMDIHATTQESPLYYYLHVRCDDYSKKANIIIDVNAPKSVSTCQVSQDGSGNYTFTMKVQDGTPPTPPNKPDFIAYTASGLHQAGWYVGGTTPDLPPDVRTAALKPSMDGSVIHGITDLSAYLFETPEVSFTVTKDQLLAPNESADDLKNKAVHFFLKDQAGNTSQVIVPMSESLIDLTFPMRVGVIAMRGGDNASVLAPVCNVVSNSNARIRADLVGAEVPNPPAGGVKIVNKHSNFSPEEINLQVAPVNKGDNTAKTFFIQSVVDINQQTPLELGIIPKKTADIPQPYVNFTFSAQFDQKNIKYTNDWSTCMLSYRFTLVPDSSPLSASGKSGSVLSTAAPPKDGTSTVAPSKDGTPTGALTKDGTPTGALIKDGTSTAASGGKK